MRNTVKIAGAALACLLAGAAQAHVLVYDMAHVSCQQLLEGHNTHWNASGTLHVGWSHPHIRGGVDMQNVVQAQPGHYQFDLGLHLSVNFFGDHRVDQVVSGASCQDSASGMAQFIIPHESAETLSAVIESPSKIKISGAVSAQVLGKTETFKLDDNVELNKA